MTAHLERAVRIEHEQLAALLVEQLRRGDAPWQRHVRAQSALPYNPHNRRRFRGVNLIGLMALSRSDPRWMTSQQATQLGGLVRSGEHGTLVHCWQFVERRDGQEPSALTHPRLATAMVFNAEQIDGLAPLPPDARREVDARQRVLQLLQQSGAAVVESAHAVHYDAASDSLVLPERARILADAEQAARALRALAHWTGHPSRLARAKRAPVGSMAAAAEELRAAIFVCISAHELGLELPRAPRTELLDAWMNLLERDPLEISRAAADAELTRAFVLRPDHDHRRTAQVAGDAATKEASVDDKPKQYLAVPYVERQRAFALGARFDREAKCWYVGPRADRDALERWVPSGRIMTRSSDAREDFAVMLRSLGLEVTGAHPIMDGRRHRLRAEGDRGRETAGLYVGRLDDVVPNGYARNYRTGQESPWSGRGPVRSPEELAELRARAAQAAAERAAERRRLELIAATRVRIRIAPDPELAPAPKQVPTHEVRADRRARLAQLPAADCELSYLTRKQICATDGALFIRNPNGRDPDWWPFRGWPCRDGTICLPARDADGGVWTMQYIGPDGSKRFEPNGLKRGCFHVIGARELGDASAIVIAEGYATATTLHEVLRDSRVAVVAGFDSGNLPDVAEGLRKRFPRTPIVVAGDNDERLLHRPPHKNVGVEKALAAAEVARGVAITPTFPQGSDPALTDFNDLATLGPSHRAAVARQVRSALELAQRQLRANTDVRRHALTRSARV